MKILRYCLKALGYLLVFLVLLAFSLYAWMVIANWNDDPLSEEAKQAMQYTPPTKAQWQDNGLLIIAGLDAPWDAADKNAVTTAAELGRKRLAREIERHAWVQVHPATTQGMPPTIERAKGEFNIMPTKLRCPQGEADCFAWYQKHKATIESTFRANQALIWRLDAAANAKQFSNPWPHYLYSDLPPYSLLKSSHELWLAMAALEWQDGKQADAIAHVAQASVLRIKLAESSNSLITSVIALALQYRELHWLSNAIAHTTPNTSGAVSSAINALLQSPAPSLNSAFAGEKQFMAGVYASIKDVNYNALFFEKQIGSPDLWERMANHLINIGFLHGETLNTSIRNLDQVRSISQLPAHIQDSTYTGYQELLDSIGGPCGRSWLDMRNAVGRCLIGISSSYSIYLSYMHRVSDIEGYRRLVRLQYQALKERQSPANIPMWLEKSQQELRNPYNLQPMHWDVATNSLVFEGKEKQTQNLNASSIYRVRLFKMHP
ncbi:hypothetical protein HNP33_001501 [Comamonas odontotermitis]|uniref:Uncharacterized protein n=1 Tax=Comamonas odontotermitis TaxID=379895 RepID=A0ABR6RE64_9BURK|nr:hypothetical protein [Comamonas odontotermitis]MBB6577445.1 hypothetical protein [Comamonas odontotermitis]